MSCASGSKSYQEAPARRWLSAVKEFQVSDLPVVELPLRERFSNALGGGAFE